VGTEEGSTVLQHLDAAFWENHGAKIEQAAKEADPAQD
jgi:hypothetical protein